MPSLRRRRAPDPEPEVAPARPDVPWALRMLLRDGPAPLVAREPRAGGELDVALVLATARHATPADAGLPAELLAALEARAVSVRTVGDAAAADAAGADVVLAAGWPAAPTVLTLHGVRARAVLATADEPPLAELGWATGMPVLGPAWMGGALPPGADAVFVPMPVHRREDLVLVHGDHPFGLLAAAELHDRRSDLSFAVSGLREELALPFSFITPDPGANALAHAFASAIVALAGPVRGWRPAALAMLACGQPVVAPDTPAARAALGDAAVVAAGPLEAADAVEALIDDLPRRAEGVRRGLERVPGGWEATAEALATELRAL